MNNYKLLIQYDGSNFSGWQIQKNAVSVQQKIVEAVEIITKEKVNLIGSGRTDSGVHAFGQVANFIIEEELDLFKFQFSMNSILPNEISIIKIEKTHKEFHSRFDAKKRSYFYLMSKVKSPFYRKYANYNKIFNEYDYKKLNEISKIYIGKHDFTSFARKKTEVENKVCEIYGIRWRETDHLVYFWVEANRFLHGMVRTLVGTFLEAAKRNYDENYLLDVLNSKDRTEAAMSVPAKGLFLYKVKY